MKQITIFTNLFFDNKKWANFKDKMQKKNIIGESIRTILRIGTFHLKHPVCVVLVLGTLHTVSFL